MFLKTVYIPEKVAQKPTNNKFFTLCNPLHIYLY